MREIENIKESNPKEDIVNYFTNTASDYREKKIEILKKLNTDGREIIQVEDAITEIENFIDNIKNSESLLDALNDDFVDGIIGSNDYINKKFTSAITQSPIKDDLDYLDTINNDGKILNNSELDQNLDCFKRLLEYDLITINLTKSI